MTEQLQCRHDHDISRPPTRRGATVVDCPYCTRDRTAARPAVAPARRGSAAVTPHAPFRGPATLDRSHAAPGREAAGLDRGFAAPGRDAAGLDRSHAAPGRESSASAPVPRVAEPDGTAPTPAVPGARPDGDAAADDRTVPAGTRAAGSEARPAAYGDVFSAASEARVCELVLGDRRHGLHVTGGQP